MGSNPQRREIRERIRPVQTSLNCLKETWLGKFVGGTDTETTKSKPLIFSIKYHIAMIVGTAWNIGSEVVLFALALFLFGLPRCFSFSTFR